jgi:hypothetical protein
MEKDKQIGLLIMTAVVVIVGLILLQGAAQNVGEATNTVAVANQSLTGVAVNGTAQYITNCRAMSDVVVWNATGDVEVASGNYTVTNNVVYNGVVATRIVPGVSATPALGYKVGTWKIDGTCQPTGYIDDGGGRAVAGIIIVFFGLLIAIIALYPAMKEMEMFR